MIQSLYIKNYALIDELKMSPSKGLNMITGETGAGKSIMLGAIGLLLGKRVDKKVLMDQTQKCIVEIVIGISKYNLKKIFDKWDIDYADECIIRREINTNGKSRAFINDTITSLEALKTIGQKLIDIHSQHETLQLSNRLYQLTILDAYASVDQLKQTYQKKYILYTETLSQLRQIKTNVTEQGSNLDYQTFLYDELVKANLDSVDQATLESTLEILKHAEEIKQNLTLANQLLNESDTAIASQLQELKNLLRSLTSISEDFANLENRVESLAIEVQDIAFETNKLQEQTEYDPKKIELIEQQLDTLYLLQKKHGVVDIVSLIEKRQYFQQQIDGAENQADEIIELEQTLIAQKKELLHAGEKLTKARLSATSTFSKDLISHIKTLGMENANITIAMTPEEPTFYGLDKVSILFSANKGIAPQEISAVASGGELSRLIFVIKYLIADKTALPTIIFDEIDAGVSGEVAIQMGTMMKQMSKNHQVISISHLPQFAAAGDVQYLVFKNHSGEKTTSSIRLLNAQERISEIAKMIGGASPSDISIENAKELLKKS